MVNIQSCRRFLNTPYRVLGRALLSGLFLLAPLAVLAADSSEQQALVERAKLTLEKALADPNMEAFREMGNEAKGVYIVPEILKGAFLFGAEGGSGVLLVKDAKTGEWSYPAFYTIGAASFGLQIGGRSSEVVMVVRTTKGLEEFYKTDFKLGVGSSIALGPVGAGATARGIAADLVSFGYSKGAFAGISLDGAGIAVSDKSNKAYYGKTVRPTDILVKHTVKNPKADALRAAAAKVGSAHMSTAPAKGK